MDHPQPWLRYVDADDLESSTFRFDDLPVKSSTGEKLGEVDGFIVDEASGRPYYVAVDAGGWFKSKLFLLPVGHVAMNREQPCLVADITKERVHRFPGFDRDEFEKLSDDELARMDEQIVASCCPTETVSRTSGRSRFDTWSHYKSPGWWDSNFYRPDRADRVMRDVGGASAVASTSATSTRTPRVGETDRSRDRDLVTARGDETNPQSGDRAKPGDVLGIDTETDRSRR
jgi:hypothetical protein